MPPITQAGVPGGGQGFGVAIGLLNLGCRARSRTMDPVLIHKRVLRIIVRVAKQPWETLPPALPVFPRRPGRIGESGDLESYAVDGERG